MEGLIFGGAYLRREFCVLKSIGIVRRKFTVFAFFYFVFEDNFPITSRRGAYIWRSELTEVFHVTGLEGLYLEGLIFGIYGMLCSLLY